MGVKAVILGTDFVGVPTFVDCYALVAPVAYNRGLTLSTNLESGPLRVYDPNLDLPNGASPVSRKIASLSKGFLIKMNQRLVTSNDDLVKSELQIDFHQITTFVAATHGDPGGFSTWCKSNPPPDIFDGMTFYDDDGKLSEVASAVSRPDDVPQPNLVVMESCNTIPEGQNRPDAYTAFFGNVRRPDVAYAGFKWVVSSQIENDPNTGAPRYLDLHAEALLNQLTSGKTIDEALGYVNANYTARGRAPDGTMQPLPMEWVGDKFTKLIGVYFGASTPNGAAQTDWYRYVQP